MPNIKSMQQQLQEAIDAGNTEMAKIIVEGMKVLESLNKPKKKARVAKPKVKKPKTVENQDTGEVEPVKPKKSPIIIPTDEDIVDLTDNIDDEGDDEDDDAPTQDGVTTIRRSRPNRDEDGKTYCVRAKLRLGRPNRFNDDLSEASNETAKASPELAKMYEPALKARKGRAKRVTKKAKVRCSKCSKIEIILLELAPRNSRYVCTECLVGGHDDV